MIKIEQLTKQFNKVKVLDGINLNINETDKIALIGSNGAGKTTLIRCLLAEYYFKGSITINDKDVHKQRKAVLKEIGFVPQLPPPLKMFVEQLLEFSASVCECDTTEMYTVMESLGLDINHIRHFPFNKLSGGQKQKLLISIAL